MYRLLLIKYWRVFKWISTSNMSLLFLAVCLLKYTLGIKLFVMGLTPKATTIYNCFYEGNSDVLCLSTFMNFMFAMILLKLCSLSRPRRHHSTSCQGLNQDMVHSLVDGLYPDRNIHLYFNFL